MLIIRLAAKPPRRWRPLSSNVRQHTTPARAMNALELVKSVTAATGFMHAAAVEVVSVEPGAVSMRMPRSIGARK